MTAWLVLIVWLVGTLVAWPSVARALLDGVPNVGETDRWFICVIALPICAIWPLFVLARILRGRGILP